MSLQPLPQADFFGQLLTPVSSRRPARCGSYRLSNEPGVAHRALTLAGSVVKIVRCKRNLRSPASSPRIGTRLSMRAVQSNLQLNTSSSPVISSGGAPCPSHCQGAIDCIAHVDEVSDLQTVTEGRQRPSPVFDMLQGTSRRHPFPSQGAGVAVDGGVPRDLIRNPAEPDRRFSCQLVHPIPGSADPGPSSRWLPKLPPWTAPPLALNTIRAALAARAPCVTCSLPHRLIARSRDGSTMDAGTLTRAAAWRTKSGRSFSALRTIVRDEASA